jgi:hypothetical protein
MKRSDLITESIKEKIKNEPWDNSKKYKLQRSKWLKWLLNIIDTIATFFK